VRKKLARVRHLPSLSPPHLGKAGAEFFLEMLDMYDIGKPAAIALLTRAAECVDRLVEAQTCIKEHGAVMQGEKLVANPACKLEKEARDGFLAAMRFACQRHRDGRPEVWPRAARVWRRRYYPRTVAQMA
jgi:hypothetical protein